MRTVVCIFALTICCVFVVRAQGIQFSAEPCSDFNRTAKKSLDGALEAAQRCLILYTSMAVAAKVVELTVDGELAQDHENIALLKAKQAVVKARVQYEESVDLFRRVVTLVQEKLSSDIIDYDGILELKYSTYRLGV